MVIECYRDSSTPSGLGGLSGIYSLRFPQEGLDIFPQRDFHCRLCVFKTTRLNSNGRVLAVTAPTVIGEPELAFDTQKRRDPERGDLEPSGLHLQGRRALRARESHRIQRPARVDAAGVAGSIR